MSFDTKLGLESLTEAIEDSFGMTGGTTEAIERHAKAMEKVAAGLHDIADAIRGSQEQDREKANR